MHPVQRERLARVFGRKRPSHTERVWRAAVSEWRRKNTAAALNQPRAAGSREDWRACRRRNAKLCRRAFDWCESDTTARRARRECHIANQAAQIPGVARARVILIGGLAYVHRRAWHPVGFQVGGYPPARGGREWLASDVLATRAETARDRMRNDSFNRPGALRPDMRVADEGDVFAEMVRRAAEGDQP